jgi:Flp pilus assembly protein TadB
MRFQRGFLAGVQLYVLVAALVTFAGLGLAVAYYKNSAARAQAEATLARDQRDRAVQAVKDSEEANKALRALNDSLDKALVERDKRAKALEVARQNLAKELDALKKTVSTEDQACLDRDLPSAFLERLRL